MRQIKENTELKVFITTGDSSCGECGEQLGRHAWITLVEGKGALCLACADLDHLAFLPSGDAALTRRARKHLTLSAVVLKWSRARKRYERQGLLVEEQAVRLAVIAHVRHAETDYDALLAQGYERSEARAQVHDAVVRIMARWEASTRFRRKPNRLLLQLDLALQHVRDERLQVS